MPKTASEDHCKLHEVIQFIHLPERQARNYISKYLLA